MICAMQALSRADASSPYTASPPPIDGVAIELPLFKQAGQGIVPASAQMAVRKGVTVLNLLRLIAWMNRSGATIVFNTILAVALSAGALSCPVWMSSISQVEMPCPDCSHSEEKCASSVCQVSSSYLASHSRTDEEPLAELPSESVDATHFWAVLAGVSTSPSDNAPPLGPSVPLFLRIHILLI